MLFEAQPRRIVSKEGTRRKVILVGLESHKNQSVSATSSNRANTGMNEPLSNSVRRALNNTGIPPIRT